MGQKVIWETTQLSSSMMLSTDIPGEPSGTSPMMDDKKRIGMELQETAWPL